MDLICEIDRTMEQVLKQTCNRVEIYEMDTYMGDLREMVSNNIKKTIRRSTRLREKNKPTHAKILNIYEKNNPDSKKCCSLSSSTSAGEIMDSEKVCSTTKRKLMEKEDDNPIIDVYHGNQCPSCEAIFNIKEENMACLQHHYKYCSCYSIYYRCTAYLEMKMKQTKRFKKKSHFLDHSQAKKLCQTAFDSEIFRENSHLFKKAAELSDQLLGPAETKTFDCDRYEKYMRLLLDISEKMSRNLNNKIGINGIDVLIEDIKNYLKPFSQKHTDEESKNNNLNRIKKWNETFVELRHSPEDEEFGRDLKEIVEPKKGEKCFFFPKKYKFPCHGQ